jgi:hypothetical protein
MWLLLALACHHELEFPDGLEPLEENLAPPPEGSEDWPETLSLVSGEDDFNWTHGRGYVREAVETVIAAVEDPDVGVDRRRVASWDVEMDTEPEYDVSYAVHTVVEDIVTVEYDLAWRHGIVSDGVLGTRWQKTEGDALIDLIEGSLVTAETVNGVTEVQFIYHLQAPMTSTEDTEQYVSDFYASILAVAHGEPLPTYE